MSNTDYTPDEYHCGICRRPKNAHYGEGHTFELRMAKTSASTAMDCPCGAAFRFEGVERDVAALHAQLKDAGWRLIAGTWRCPRCGQRHDRAEERKAKELREKVKSEQAVMRW